MKRVLVFLWVVIGLVSCGGNGGLPADTVVVEMHDSGFVPSRLEINVGTTVRWRNTTGVAHTVTADSIQARDPENVLLPEGAESFDSERIEPGGVFEYTFTVPGTYRYFSVPYEGLGMVGELVVEPEDKNGQE
ncbi:MAG: plastocyanin/azurin family copper-binding protein [Chitinispirillaceae bacterium]